MKALAIGLQIESDRWSGNDVDVETVEGDRGDLADAQQASTDDVQRVLGGEEQYGTSAGGTITPQASDTGGDSHGQVECQKRLAALGLTAHDADGLVSPQAIDKPAERIRTSLKLGGAFDLKGLHRRRRVVVFVLRPLPDLGATLEVKTSR